MLRTCDVDMLSSALCCSRVRVGCGGWVFREIASFTWPRLEKEEKEGHMLRAASVANPLSRVSSSRGVRHASILSTLSSLFRGSRPNRHHVGSDESGNNYFASEPPSKTMTATTSHVKEIRTVEMANGSDCAFSSHPCAHITYNRADGSVAFR